MSKDLMCIIIAKMHIRLNQLIVNSNYDLQSNEVQHYSRRLDKVLTHYGKVTEKKKAAPYGKYPLRIVKNYLVSL
jgi:hypothetical protein